MINGKPEVSILKMVLIAMFAYSLVLKSEFQFYSPPLLFFLAS